MKKDPASGSLGKYSRGGGALARAPDPPLVTTAQADAAMDFEASFPTHSPQHAGVQLLTGQTER
jgi:hypothetical protein